MQIIKPTHDDIPKLLILWKEQFDYHYQLDDVLFNVKYDQTIAESLTKYMHKAIDNGAPYVLAAKVDNELVGFILFNIETDNYYDTIIERSGVVMELCVREKFRGQGIGPKLLNYAEENYFTPQDVVQIRVMVSSFNKPALALYEKLGYVKRQITFYKNNL